jgi:hypothetical protein
MHVLPLIFYPITASSGMDARVDAYCIARVVVSGKRGATGLLVRSIIWKTMLELQFGSSDGFGQYCKHWPWFLNISKDQATRNSLAWFQVFSFRIQRRESASNGTPPTVCRNLCANSSSIFSLLAAATSTASLEEYCENIRDLI